MQHQPGNQALAAIAILALFPTTFTMAQQTPVIAGWVEPVTIAGIAIEAKLDTGAETSSLDARDIVQFNRNGEAWVRFKLPRARRGEDTASASPAIESKLVRTARIKRADAATAQRPVVSLKMCLGGLTFPAEFTLTDRTGLDYAALIGRAALGPRFAVDAARTNLTDGRCAVARP